LQIKNQDQEPKKVAVISVPCLVGRSSQTDTATTTKERIPGLFLEKNVRLEQQRSVALTSQIEAWCLVSSINDSIVKKWKQEERRIDCFKNQKKRKS